MNYSVIAFPCLMYLASLGTCLGLAATHSANPTYTASGITSIYQSSRPISTLRCLAFVIDYEVPYFSISSALNILLTLMIVTRLFLLHRNVKRAMNAPVRVNGLYRVIVTSLIESCAIYSATLVLFIGLLATSSPFFGVVLPIFLNVQVCVASSFPGALQCRGAVV